MSTTTRVVCLVVSLCGLGCGGGEAKPDAGTGPGDGAISTPDGGEPAAVTTSADLIDQDLAAEKIDSKTAALFALLAQVQPARLPAAYQSTKPYEGLPSVNAAVAVTAHLAEYGPTEAAAARAMLTDPEDPDWLKFPAEMSRFAEGAPSCMANYDAEGGGGRFIGQKRDTKHFRIRAILPKLADVAGQQEVNRRIDEALAATVPGVGGVGTISFADYLDQVYEYYANKLKMTIPSDLPKVVANGGLIPIYVATCDGALNYAAAALQGFIFVSVGMAFEEEQLRRVVIPHEIFHIFEYAYHVPVAPEGKDWPLEASAVAVEDFVAPGIRRWDGSFATNPNVPPGALNPMDRLFQCPEEPIHSVYRGPCNNRPDSAKHYSGDYSKFVLLKFLMRNRGQTLNLFWYELAQAGGDPSNLIDPDDLGALQLALLGDTPGDAYFDAGDRAAFYRGSGKRNLDRAPGDAERYTLKVDPQQVIASKTYRFTPTDDVSESRTLKRMDSGSSPILAGATHRVLLEIPDEVASLTDPAAATRLALNFRFQGCTKCTVNVTAVQPGSSGPGQTFDTSYSATQVTASATAVTKTYFSTPVSQGQPRYVLAVISNLGDGPVTWKAGFTLVAACEKACGDFYKNQRLLQSCPQGYCKGYSDPTEKQECITSQSNMTRSDAMFGWCPYVCTGDSDVSEPYPAQKSTNCNYDWQKDVCSNGGVADCESVPAGFVPIPDWPNVPCTEIKSPVDGEGVADCSF